MASPKLNVPLFNVEQNEQYRLGMLEKEKLEQEYREKEVEVEIDYLAPYLVKIKNLSKLTYTQANQIRNLVLADYKQLLLNRAIDIQKQFERVRIYLLSRSAIATKCLNISGLII